MSAQQRQSARPDSAPQEEEPLDPAPLPTPAEPPGAGLTRRERREAARGGPSVKIAGPPVGQRPAVRAKHRDYAARRRG